MGQVDLLSIQNIPNGLMESSVMMEPVGKSSIRCLSKVMVRSGMGLLVTVIQRLSSTITLRELMYELRIPQVSEDLVVVKISLWWSLRHLV